MLRPSLICCVYLALLGCFDVSQTFTVDNGEMEFQLRFGVNTALIAMSAIDDDIPVDDFCDAGKVVHNANSEQLSTNTELKIDDNMLLCTVTVTSPLNGFTELSINPPWSDKPTRVIEIQEVSSSELLVISEFEIPPRSKDTEVAMLLEIIADLISDYSFRWQVNAPEILHANGTISNNRQTVDWEVPMIDALGSADKYRFEAQIKLSRRWWEA